MRRLIIAILLITLMSILAACAPASTSADQTNPQAASVPTVSSSSGTDPSTTADLTRTDQQGAVTVIVTPLNLDNPSEQLEFNVALETHSVDLSMDLATLATLVTDTGITVPATLWDAPRGGHHVSGKLIFPTTKDGTSILEDATTLTLIIVDVDASSRVFEWDLK